jgi:hypothetical protein
MLGCSTIVGDPTAQLPISSAPSGADIKITEEKGNEIFNGNTPATVVLEKSTGRYFGSKTYKIEISKSGYGIQAFSVTAKPSGWFIFGNLFSWGPIGWLAVDPFNGKMYKLSEKNITANLATSTPGESSAGKISLNIIKLQEVPPSLRDKLELLPTE